MVSKNRIIVGISGASGFVYGMRVLELLKKLDVETHLVISKSAQLTRELETEFSDTQVKALANYTYAANDITAPMASGSFKTIGMIVAPCSVRTLSEIASGVANSLLTRAADVVLKERRKLVLLVRETPLHSGHLQSMLQVSQMGGIIAPPVPAFYNKPTTLDDIVNHTVGRALDLFDFDLDIVKRWPIEK